MSCLSLSARRLRRRNEQAVVRRGEANTRAHLGYSYPISCRAPQGQLLLAGYAHLSARAGPGAGGLPGKVQGSFARPETRAVELHACACLNHVDIDALGLALEAYYITVVAHWAAAQLYIRCAPWRRCGFKRIAMLRSYRPAVLLPIYRHGISTVIGKPRNLCRYLS